MPCTVAALASGEPVTPRHNHLNGFKGSKGSKGSKDSKDKQQGCICGGLQNNQSLR